MPTGIARSHCGRMPCAAPCFPRRQQQALGVRCGCRRVSFLLGFVVRRFHRILRRKWIVYQLLEPGHALADDVSQLAGRFCLTQVVDFIRGGEQREHIGDGSRVVN